MMLYLLAKMKMVDVIETWCRVANITIGNRQAWSLGENLKP